ncbi:MAG: hypothetical protein ACKO1J_17035 [Tagaea sp.]
MTLLLFELLIAAHIVTGTTGAIAFWVPVVGRKGGPAHAKWGKVFAFALIATGCFAMAMSVFTLAAPLETHPHLAGRLEPDLIRGIFGWMMLAAGLLTVNLAWYGWLAIRNKGRHVANRTPLNAFLQVALVPASLACVWQSWVLQFPLIGGIAIVGLATAATNSWFLLARDPGPAAWLKEHVKALVGAGISVYTAFMAFGSVRLIPELALNPFMWAVPLSVGVGLILWHWRAIDRRFAGGAGRLPAIS